MKHFFKNFVFKVWPVIAIFSIILLLFLTNYGTHTWLIGWDNLMPEFNLNMNIERSIFAVWQEYQGLGLLGGMGHSADIIHQLAILLLSFALPVELLRYTWTFLMLFTGSTGAYFLLKKLIFKESKLSKLKIQFLSLTGAIFYLLNLSTIQSFYVPFEAFTAHFAALPWLLLSSLLFFLKPNRKNGLFFVTVLILATPHAYIPTLFVVYVLSLLILIFSLFIFNKANFSWKSLGITLFTIFIVNSFWLLPFLYFTLTNSNVALDAKINQMATQTVFLQNKAFGNIFDVMLLKGFWFNNVDPNFKGAFTYMLLPWRDYLANPYIQIIGYLFFGLILTGVISALKKGGGILIAFFFLFLFSATMLMTNTAPFSWLDIIFRKIPLFDQIFRFPFTKFSILTSLTYSIFLALGIAKITSLPAFKKLNFYILNFIFIILLIIFIFPVFQGHLFYSKEKVVIPEEYFQVFDYFKNQDQNTRIANFPQYTFWGWNYYTWGYGGSGFLWYGIKQPILDRAFDVWSKTDENYYWEISNALYSKNLQAFEAVLNKYQVNWLLVDKNVFNPTSSKALFIPELNSLIAQIPSIQKTKSFGNIDVYRVNLKDNPKNFVFIANALNSSNDYQWGNFDKAYLNLGNYISSDNPDFYYPFRSLFSNKNNADKEFDIKNGNTSLTISAMVGNKNGQTLNIPSLAETEDIIPASLIAEKTDSNLTISVLIQTPEISIINGSNSRIIYAQNFKEPLFVIPQNYSNTINVNINGSKNFTVNSSTPQSIGTGFLSLKQENIITVSNNIFKVLQTKTISPSYIISAIDKNNKKIDLSNIKDGSYINVTIPKINDGYVNFEKSPSKDLISQVKNCDNFNKGPFSASIIYNGMLQLESQNSTACISFYISTLIHNQGYALFIRNENIAGRGLHMWVLNENEKNAPIDTYFDEKQNIISSFIIPPAESFGRAYSLHFDNISITNDKTINNLGTISLYAIPYSFLTSINITTAEITTNKSFTNQAVYVNHPNEAYYEVKGIEGEKTLILSQSYDQGWHAYVLNNENPLNKLFPFLGGKELKNHVLVNNWENGWILDSKFNKNNRIIIVYLPQYLEFLGFLLLFLTLICILLSKHKKLTDINQNDRI